MLMFGKSQGHDCQTRDAGARLNIIEGGQELFAIVDAGTQDDLGVDLYTRIEKTLEHLDAARGVATYELTAAIGVGLRGGSRSWGDSILSMASSTSWSDMLVSVTKLPCRKLRR